MKKLSAVAGTLDTPFFLESIFYDRRLCKLVKISEKINETYTKIPLVGPNFNSSGFLRVELKNNSAWPLQIGVTEKRLRNSSPYQCSIDSISSKLHYNG